MFHHYFVQPFIDALQFTAGLVNDNYGLAIVFITLAVRLVLMPLMLKSYKSSQSTRRKMEGLKPELSDIQQRMKNTDDKEEKVKLQSDMMALYQKHGVNPMQMGCLPMLIQMPLFIGLYYAIRSSEEIATHSFLWFDLGQTDVALALLAAAVYFIQSRLSMTQMPVEQQGMVKMMSWISPVMIGLLSLNAPSALPLYWATGGLFLILQTYLSKKLYQE
ncbi:membrane protein insertase YidC [Halobacillus litoralis]|uniref:membrane protein insertase YidC n=1 Tax=Halobacillus litoralis TaxID=45668 RepID=UPI001CD60500|nr:membrane protein insertase YidC [Halobacillus litoralis]MCA0969773.1 membrane protein insertase YidC [Halobacillus litoralis]